MQKDWSLTGDDSNWCWSDGKSLCVGRGRGCAGLKEDRDKGGVVGRGTVLVTCQDGAEDFLIVEEDLCSRGVRQISVTRKLKQSKSPQQPMTNRNARSDIATKMT